MKTRVVLLRLLERQANGGTAHELRQVSNNNPVLLIWLYVSVSDWTTDHSVLLVSVLAQY
jgi:hypothetical protein